MTEDELQKSIQAHAHFFSSVLDLVSPEIYFPREQEPEHWRRSQKSREETAARKIARKKTVKQSLNPKLQKKVSEELKTQELASKDAVFKKSEPKSIANLRERLRERIEALRKLRTSSTDDVNRRDPSGLQKRKREGPLSSPQNKKKKLEPSEHQEHSQPKKEPQDEAVRFGTFDFSGGKPVPSYLVKKKPKTEALLKKAEAELQYLKSIEDTESGKEQVEKRMWERLNKKASGEKLKDDPKLLKKTLKREKARKKKSAKEWSERIKAQEEQQKKKAARREANLKAHSQRKRLKKAGKAAKKFANKKKLSRPGFEGKKKHFLNK